MLLRYLPTHHEANRYLYFIILRIEIVFIVIFSIIFLQLPLLVPLIYAEKKKHALDGEGRCERSQTLGAIQT